MSPGDDERDDDLFREAMRDVVPLRDRHRRARDAPPAQPGPGRPAPRLLIEDDGEIIEARGPGVSRRQLRELRAGRVAIDDTLDLHGMKAADARRAIRERLEAAQRANARCVRLIHGRGLHSGEAGPVLRRAVIECLTTGATAQLVRAFCTAARRDGGPGAILVALIRPTDDGGGSAA